MADPATGFEEAEFRRRNTALQAALARSGIDALLLTTPADIFYVTGFLTRFWESPARPWFVVVPAAGAPVAVIPAIGAELMARGWVRDIRTWNAPDPENDGTGLLAEAIREFVPEAGRIGVPMGDETRLRMPLASYTGFLGRVAPRAIVDATAALHGVREIKSEAEIARIRAACAIAGRAFARVPELVAGGMPLDRVFRSFQIALLDAGADWVSYLAGGAGPDGYADVISPADDRALRAGDVMMLDTGAVRGGYFCDFDRNYSVGPPSDAVRRAHEALFEATERAITSLRPGLRASEVHATLCAELRSRGAEPIAGRFGHGLGLSLTEWPSVSAGDRTVLRAGMVLTLEPGAEVMPGRILVHEEVVALREDGAELLSPRAEPEMRQLAP